MRKIVAFALAMVFLLSACSGDSKSLSSGTVEDLVETMLENSGQDQGFIPIQIGYYELNNMDSRYQLSRLSAAGLITYKVECYDWWNKVLQISNYWGGSYGSTSYNEEKHVMVRVELTDKGRKLVVDSIPQPEELIDKEMEQPQINEEDYPENKITRENYQKTFENWPQVPNPEGVNSMYVHRDESTLSTENVKAKKSQSVERKNYFEDNNQYLKQVEQYKNSRNYEVISMDIQTSSNYANAKRQEKKDVVIMKTFKLKVEKARFIRTVETDAGLSATAEVIIRFSDVTPVGRAWQEVYDGCRLCAPVRLTYYDDKGWVLSDKYLQLSSSSSLGDMMTRFGRVEFSDGSVTPIDPNEAEGPGESEDYGMY